MTTEPACQPRTILVVEDEPDLRETIVDQLEALGHRVVAAVAAPEAIEVLEHGGGADLVLTDVRMPGMTGVELCTWVKTHPRLRLTPVVILTANADLEARVAGLRAGADDFFAKPAELIELRARVTALLRTKALLDELEEAEHVMTTLGLAIEARDAYTAGHCQRLSRLATEVGDALGVDARTRRALALGGFLHDIGKLVIPDRVLLKAGPLAPDERATVMTHPAAGADLVARLRTLTDVRPIIRHHHERWDGSGYPDGLAGEAIPPEARIMAVVDVYDALRTARPYKAAMSAESTLATVVRETDRGWWEPRVVQALVRVVAEAAPE